MINGKPNLSAASMAPNAKRSAITRRGRASVQCRTRDRYLDGHQKCKRDVTKNVEIGNEATERIMLQEEIIGNRNELIFIFTCEAVA